jgi:hypothetical protein
VVGELGLSSICQVPFGTTDSRVWFPTWFLYTLIFPLTSVVRYAERSLACFPGAQQSPTHSTSGSVSKGAAAIPSEVLEEVKAEVPETVPGSSESSQKSEEKVLEVARISDSQMALGPETPVEPVSGADSQGTNASVISNIMSPSKVPPMSPETSAIANAVMSGEDPIVHEFPSPEKPMIASVFSSAESVKVVVHPKVSTGVFLFDFLRIPFSCSCLCLTTPMFHECLIPRSLVSSL